MSPGKEDCGDRHADSHDKEDDQQDAADVAHVGDVELRLEGQDGHDQHDDEADDGREEDGLTGAVGGAARDCDRHEDCEDGQQDAVRGGLLSEAFGSTDYDEEDNEGCQCRAEVEPDVFAGVSFDIVDQSEDCDEATRHDQLNQDDGKNLLDERMPYLRIVEQFSGLLVFSVSFFLFQVDIFPPLFTRLHFVVKVWVSHQHNSRANFCVPAKT